jgi:hypothetical protein
MRRSRMQYSLFKQVGIAKVRAFLKHDEFQQDRTHLLTFFNTHSSMSLQTPPFGRDFKLSWMRRFPTRAHLSTFMFWQSYHISTLLSMKGCVWERPCPAWIGLLRRKEQSLMECIFLERQSCPFLRLPNRWKRVISHLTQRDSCRSDGFLKEGKRA